MCLRRVFELDCVLRNANSSLYFEDAVCVPGSVLVLGGSSQLPLGFSHCLAEAEADYMYSYNIHESSQNPSILSEQIIQNPSHIDRNCAQEGFENDIGNLCLWEGVFGTRADVFSKRFGATWLILEAILAHWIPKGSPQIMFSDIMLKKW